MVRSMAFKKPVILMLVIITLILSNINAMPTNITIRENVDISYGFIIEKLEIHSSNSFQFIKFNITGIKDYIALSYIEVNDSVVSLGKISGNELLFELPTPEKAVKTVIVFDNIFDLRNNSLYIDVRGNFYTGAKAAVVVFDITSRDSYEHVKNWIEELRKHVKDSIPILLVGNKIDLREEADNALTFEDGKKLAEELSNELGQEIPYIETSAKEGQNIDESFERLFNLIIDSYLKKVKSKS